MFMAVVMLIAWQGTGEPKYQAPFQKSVEAVYAGSELKGNVDKVNDRIKDKAPIPAAVAPVGYALFIKKQVTFTSTKLSPVPNTVSTYNYDEKAKSGSVGITWRF